MKQTSRIIWFDGFDIPMVTHFDASLAEHLKADEQAVTCKIGDSLARYGANMLPVDHAAKTMASPIFNYLYDRSRAALETMKAQNELDPGHGLKMRYVNPVDGSYAASTIAPFLQLLPKGFSTAAYRSTDATVYVCVEGPGRTTVAGTVFDWGPRDIFVVPSWHWLSYNAMDESVLFPFPTVLPRKSWVFGDRREGICKP